MPGHANSPYWAAVDFDSEGDEEKTPPPSNRVYLDPWDNDAFGMLQGESPDFSQEQMNSFAGEPVSASFYYVPTKTYDSGEEPKSSKRSLFPEDVITPDYSVYGRRTSRHNMIPPDYDRDMPIYGYRPIPERRRSMYIEEPVYIPVPHPMVYESLYGPMPMQNPYMHPPRPRISLQHHPDYMMANGYGKHRRHSRIKSSLCPSPGRKLSLCDDIEVIDVSYFDDNDETKALNKTRLRFAYMHDKIMLRFRSGPDSFETIGFGQ